MESSERVETTPAFDGVGTTAPTWPGLHRAREIAAAHGTSSVGTQHVLLALLSGPEDPSDDALRALVGSGVSHPSVREALRAIEGAGVRRTPKAPGAVRVSARVQALLAAASRRAGVDRHGTVSNRDVLETLLDTDDPAVAHLILTYIGARRRVLDALDLGPSATTRRVSDATV